MVEGKQSSFPNAELENKGKGAGIVYGILGRLWLKRHCAGMVADLRRMASCSATILTELEAVLAMFSDFATFEREFPAVAAGETAHGADAAGGDYDRNRTQHAQLSWCQTGR